TRPAPSSQAAAEESADSRPPAGPRDGPRRARYNDVGHGILSPEEGRSMKSWTRAALAVLAGATALAPAAGWGAALPPAAVRGRHALLSRSYSPPTMSLQAYDNAWRHWGLKSKPAPADYDRLFRERYGLHPAPFDNGGYPMGLRVATAVGP